MSPRPQFTAAEVAARRTAILDSTIDQIAQRGPEAVRMKDVAAGSQVSVGTVQYYFGSRDELLVQAFSAHSSTVIEAIAELSDEPGDAWERLRSTLRAVPSVEYYERRSSVWVELVAAARRNEFLRASVAEVFERWRAHFEQIIRAGIAEGSFTPRIDPGLVVDTIIALIDGFDLARASGRTEPESAAIVASLEATAAALLSVPTALITS